MRTCFAGMAAIFLLPAAAPAQEGLPAGGEIRRNLREILSGGEYDTGLPQADPAGSIGGRILKKISEFLDGLVFLGESSPAFFWLVLIACLVVLAAIFAHGGVILARSLRASRSGGAGAEKAGGREAEDGGALLERARLAAREGRFTQAIRLCHRAALLGLDRRGLVRFQESLTSGDYRRQLGTHARERSLYDALARLYEPAFFGRVPSGNPEFSESLRLASALAQEAPA